MTDYTGGPGNDSYTITPADGTSTIDGGGGTDTLTVDLSSSTTHIYGYYHGPSGGNYGYIYDSGAGQQVSFSSIEKLTFKEGGGDDTFTLFNGVATLDGGRGTDRFTGYFSESTAAITFALNTTAGSTSTFTGQGSSLKNFESVDLTTGSGNDSLTGGNLSDNLDGGTGNNTLKGGAGDDQLYSHGGADTVDGGADNDYWIGDYSTATAALTFSHGSGSAYTLSNGATLVNVENITLSTGSGADDLTMGLSSSSSSTFDGGGGTDTMTIDWSGGTSPESGYYNGIDYGNNGYAYEAATDQQVFFNNIEKATIKFGSGDDTFRATNGVVAFDGGGGTDRFTGDFGDSYEAISFTLNTTAGSTSTFTGQGSSLKNVESVVITTGSGNDSLTGGNLADNLDGGTGSNTLNSGAGDDQLFSHTGGIDTVDGGADNDTWTGDYGTAAAALIFAHGSGSAYTLSNGGSVVNVENITLTTGTGNDDLTMGLTGSSSSSSFDGGGGTDSMTIDWSAGTSTETGAFNGPAAGYALDVGTNQQVSFTNFEKATIKFGGGNDSYTVSNAVATLDGGAGTDRFSGYFAGSTTAISFALNTMAGSTSTFIGQGSSLTNFEAVGVTTGSGNDSLTGGALEDSFDGGDGNDTIDGGAGLGTDHLVGGIGNDTLSYASASMGVTVSIATQDINIDTAGAGTDYISGFENLTGSRYADTLTGDGGANIIDGGLGGDSMAGGGGADVYYVDNSGDTVTEAANAGLDEIRTTLASYTLGANVEKLTGLLATGQTLTGNGVYNTITGGAGDDTIDGGVGGDLMTGGGGNDTYTVDNVQDQVVEAANGGTDIVYTTLASYTIGANVENLLGLVNSGQTLTGNTLANYIQGGNGADTLNGGAGADRLDGGGGADTMVGGDDNDIYYVDNVGDITTETATGGVDNVYARDISWTLAANVEHLTLLGTGNTNAYGNADGNRLTGNDANNILDGRGGDDLMFGGKGDDVYYVDQAGDQVFEAANAGSDAVVTSLASYTLADNVEELDGAVTTGQALTGNALDNKIFGNSGNDILDGGAGADVMQGGDGNDIYIYDNALDRAIEAGTTGIDEVRTYTASTALTLNVENLTGMLATGQSLTGNGLDNHIVAGAGNDTLDGTYGADTMEGGLGNDLYFVDDAGDVVTEGANAGTDTVYSSISYTLGANLENLLLTGTASSNATGNAAANTLTGNNSDNVLNGMAGADTMAGLGGNDTYYVDQAGDSVSEGYNAGTDTVVSAISYTLGDNVENLVLIGTATSGTGNGLDNALTGNDRANNLSGGAGKDMLDGGLGADAMRGGDGDDTYVVDNAGDTVTEYGSNGAGGVDTVQSSISYTLGAFVENLTLTGTADINATGNELDNMLVGNGGNNVLDGGLGADTMAGGLGNDTYYRNSTGDVVIENAAAGVDTVFSAFNYTLGDNVENLTLTGSATLGTGNALDNVLIGNGLNNSLSGGAGADDLDGRGGADVMKGGDGNDIYHIDDAGDQITEYSNGGLGGTDLVLSTISYTLGANLENLTLTGTANVNAVGNSVANILVGNDGANDLDGLAGADQMAGGLGNDTYHVDVSGDVVTEAVNAGVDTVVSAISYTLGANVENLTLTGSAATAIGNTLDNVLTGDAIANQLFGDAGADTLDGKGGGDVMKGGDGNDTYYVDDSGDAVTEFNSNGQGGVDTVISTISYTLGSNVENLTLAGPGAIDATGNSLANILTAGDGVNTLTGGAGNDMFAFATAPQANGDRIADFQTGDRIDLHLIDADTTHGGDDAFSFIGAGAFTHHAGELQVTYASGLYTVAGDTDGNGAADFSFAVTSNHPLVAGDFML